MIDSLLVQRYTSHNYRQLITKMGEEEEEKTATKMIMKKREVLMERGMAELRGRIWLSWGGWPEYTPEE